MENENLADLKKEEILQEEITYQSISTFLENSPPNQWIKISDLIVYDSSHSRRINTPEIKLYCSHESCNGTRFFRCLSVKGHFFYSQEESHLYFTYTCSNCQRTTKIFSLAAKMATDDNLHGECYKFGESPAYGPPLPPRLLKKPSENFIFFI